MNMPISEYEESLNPARWKGLFVSSLRKVQREVHPSLSVQDEALEYIEGLIIHMMYHLCACQPRTVADVEDRVTKTFPDPIDKWAISDAQDAIAKGRKKSPLVLPADKVHPLIKDILCYKVDYQVSLYIVAVMEYISADIIKLAGNYVKNIRHMEITCQDIKVALFADKVLMDMFHPDDMEASLEEESSGIDEMLTYEEVVREMMVAEYKYNRDLNMIIKVFRAPFIEAKHLFSQEDIDKIFSNITEVYDFAVMFTGLLDAALETAEEGKPPNIGECFEEMAEAAEFEVYEQFAQEQTALASKLYRHLGIGGKLYELLARPNVAEYFRSKRPKFKETVQYCLPKLLMTPIYHCMHYFDVLKLLLKTSPDPDDLESLEQAESALGPLQATIERIISSGTLGKRKEDKFSKAQKRKSGVLKSAAAIMNDLQRNIEGWEGKDISQTCTEVLKEGLIGKLHPNKKNTERFLFLLDGLLICCKQNTRHSLSGQANPEYRLKEKYFLRKAEINDLEDTEDVKNAFEVVQVDQPKSLFVCKNEAEKNEWMAMLMTLYMRSTMDRLLDHILMEEEKAIPLRIPSPEEYCFAIEDADDNIVFEDGQEKSVAPVIKGGTLVKLIERLTHHKYADPTFVRTFLTTYRSFCKPRELLDLLIKRFKIPEPPPSEEDNLAMERGKTVLREDLKRFRKEYAQPVQLRVLNGIRHWVDNHFYDFERDAQLLKKLQVFLEEVNGKAMRRWVESINKVIERKTSWDTGSMAPEITFERDPPQVEWHLAKDIEKFDILTLHPIEIARQLTLLESELYRAVRPSELVGSVWTKEDIKHLTSPNLLKMIHHTNKITVWFEKSIVEMSNLEERVAVLTRIIDILTVFQELNNFNGILEVVSALNSAPIFRLQHTFAELTGRRAQVLEEAKELSSDHYKKYIEKLRSINPPCVPFFGMYLTNILKTEEGNPDFLPNCPEGIINFSKRRKVAEITGEIQQYQNQPYCLRVEDSIREYLENLDPFNGRDDKEMEDYLYRSSLEIEPRNCEKLPKFTRKTEMNLKSPGTKPGFQGSRLSISSQPSLRRTMSQASAIFQSDFEVFSPTSSTFHASLPRTPLSASTFIPSETTPQIPESPTDADDNEPDYVNIENFPEGEESPPPVPPPPSLPPRPGKQRATSVTSAHEERAPPAHLVQRMNSMPLISTGFKMENDQLPGLPPKPDRPLSLQRDANAPPLPPRHPLRVSPTTPPPLPPRSSHPSIELKPSIPLPPRFANVNDVKSSAPKNGPEECAPPALPPALPPKTRKS